MGRRPGPNRILGPYAEADGGWSCTEVVAGLHRRVRCRDCSTEEEARDFAEGLRAALDSPPPMSVREAVDAFVDQVRARSGNTESAAFAKSALAAVRAAGGDRPVYRLAPHHLEAAAREIAPRTMATRRSYTKAWLRFTDWLARRGHTGRDVGADWLKQHARRDEPMPWRTPAGAREVNRGKVQLRNQAEVEAYLSAALALTYPDRCKEDQRDRVAAERRVAACLPILCGLSNGEVLHARVGDIDLKAGVGHVRDGGAIEADGWHVKTASRTGQWQIPGVLRADLKALTRRRMPHELLLHDVDGKPHTRGWLRDLVRDVCEAARVKENEEDPGVPIRVVCPHGLRGTHATLLRVLMGRQLGDIASALRHGDAGRVARAHYVGAPETRPALRVVRSQSSAVTSTERSVGKTRS